MPRIVIALGSNLNHPAQQVRRAAAALRQPFPSLCLSPLVSSAPMYVADQPAFVNAVAIAETDLAPQEVFGVLKTAEHYLGRTETFRNGPRQIDLDLILYGCLRYRTEFSDGSDLIVPHPRVAERLFVMQPWLSLDPAANLPGGISVLALHDALGEPPLAEVDHAGI
ncbi:MAG: 2-amino-4-hydroxy-6-hydroxymethyldihydropteridine diphosphokinase [Chthonomonas sp.]|nr:2-amino-4-hydroxy-6-hydroxymethyldihydropteridine diphosphokinase [Chthonomonas sp.]